MAQLSNNSTPYNRQQSLLHSVKIGVEQSVNLDFNRLRFFGVPTVNEINKRNVRSANREKSVVDWCNAFKNAHEYSDITLHGYFGDLAFYVNLTDNAGLSPDSKEAVELFEITLIEHVRLGKHSVGWARKLLSGMKTVFKLFDWNTASSFSQYPIFANESTPTPAYSDNELKVILKFLTSGFSQLEKQIRDNPNFFIVTSSRKKNYTLDIQSKKVDISGAITKCFCFGYFLMSYYTWANNFCLLKLKRPKERSTSTGKWFSASVEKKRAGKFVTIELGDNNSSVVPKHGLKIIEKLVELSHLISPDTDRLFHSCIDGDIRPLENNSITQFNNWAIKAFKLTADNGWPLRLQSQRFRVTGSNRYLSLTGDQIGTSILLNNTPNVVRRHYSTGNEHENNLQLQAISGVLEGVAKCKHLDEAIDYSKEKLGVEVLPYEAFIAKYTDSSKPEKVVIGTGCKDPFSKQAAKYNKKHKSLINSETNLACADILKCFGCENQVIIEEVDDIWCLLSFKEALKDAQYDHLDGSQYRKNYETLLYDVDEACFRVAPKVRRFAEKKLMNDGRHPLWPEGQNLEL